MPAAFRHQVYNSDSPAAEYELIGGLTSCLPENPKFYQSLAEAGRAFSAAGVVAVYCVHGTFAGTDALGFITELSRFAPSAAAYLRRWGKRLVDVVIGETGNYTSQFIETLADGLSAEIAKPIPVARYLWSSQNNHIARADGAVGLIDQIARSADRLASQCANPRVLLWGHSHAGNLFALATELFAADAAVRREFFSAARTFYQPWLGRQCDQPAWERVESILADAHHPIRRLKFDVVTFGTPIRYGWNLAGCDKLLHFVGHRPIEGKPNHLGPQWINPLRLLRAAEGDYIFQLGIAGSNIPPFPLAVRTLLADVRLGRFLERRLQPEGLFSRVGYGRRVPEVGTTLLVDYPERWPLFLYHLAGHAAYTRQKWLPFHCRQIAKHFYAAEANRGTP